MKISIFLIALVVNVALAIYQFLYLEYLFVDSVARTMHAFYVFWGNNAPHLAAIGFIWMPLPTIVQLPFVLWKPLALTGLAGGLQSALCMAAAIVALDAIIRTLGAGRWTRWILLAAFQLNPMTLMYGANGMSEAMLIAALLWMCYYFLLWTRTGQSRYIVLLGTIAAAAIMTRYESFALVAAGAVAITLVNLQYSASRARTGGELLAFLAPPAYAMIIWMHLNATIMGDPLHFYRGAYSNAAQIAFFPEELGVLTHNPILTSIYVAQRILLMAPLYLPVVALGTAITLFRRDMIAFGLLMLPASLLAFSWLNQFQGQSYGWFRFFIYAVPGVAIGTQLLLRPRQLPSWLSSSLAALLLILAIPANLVTGFAMMDEKVGREEFPVVQAALQNAPVERSGEIEMLIVPYLQKEAKKRSVLLDDFSGLELIRVAGGTELFVAGVDPDFQDTLREPFGKVEYFLVPKPEGLGTLDAINRMYPGAYQDILPFLQLEQDFGQWRLFRVTSNPSM